MIHFSDVWSGISIFSRSIPVFLLFLKILRFSYLLVHLLLAAFLLVALLEVFVLEVLSHFGLSRFLDRNSVKVVVCFVIAAGFLFESLALEKVAACFVCDLRHVSKRGFVFEHLLLLFFGRCRLF